LADPLTGSVDESAAPVAPSTGGRIFRRLAAALTYRDFRILWLGACISSTGTWMQGLAENWLVLTLTSSAFYLGLDAFLQQLPILLFTVIGGVFADRHDRRRTLLTSQYVQMTSALILAVLVYLNVVKIPYILALSFLTGCAQAFGGPAYQSLMPSLVSKDHVPNAVALNSIQFNLARVIGPLLAGLVLTSFASFAYSERIAMGSCFALNAASFFVVILALLSLHVKHVPPTHRRAIAEELRTGLSYVRHEPGLLALTILAFATAFLGYALMTLLPLFARSVFKEGVAEYSRMMAFQGAGAVAGALGVAWMGRYRHMGRLALVTQMIFGTVLVAFALSRTLPLSYLLLFIAGGTLIVANSTIISLVQLIAPNRRARERLRGKHRLGAGRADRQRCAAHLHRVLFPRQEPRDTGALRFVTVPTASGGWPRTIGSIGGDSRSCRRTPGNRACL
jgi:MFS family permease